MRAQRTVVADAALCPRCGGRLQESRLDDAESTRLGVALSEAADGGVLWHTCSNCGYAALHADPRGWGVVLPAPGLPSGTAPAGAAPGAAKHPEPTLGLQHPVRAAAAAFGPFERTRARTVPRDPSVLQTALVFVSAALGITGPVLVFLTSGALMSVGVTAVTVPPSLAAGQAFVAPDWIWFVPLGVMTMMAAFLVNVLVAHDLDRPHLIVVFWAVLFGPLGAQLLVHGLSSAGAGGIEWGWVAAGAVLALLAVPAVAVIFLPQVWKGFDGVYRSASLLGLAAGLLLAVGFFSAFGA
jgi:hypothetical protein